MMTETDHLEPLRDGPLREAVGRLLDLVEKGAPAFLLGAGCSLSAGLPLTGDLTKNVLKSGKLDDQSRSILEATEEGFTAGPAANIEDFISEMVDYLAISSRRDTRIGAKAMVATPGGDFSSDQVALAIEQTKIAIAEQIDVPLTTSTHQAFVRAVHAPLRPSRWVSSRVVDYLVLNYDTAMEDALALEKVPFADGMEGGVTAWWSPDTFKRKGIEARVLKLHGSIDWEGQPDSPLPRRAIRAAKVPDAPPKRVMIWPASTKYRETQLDPYAQLIVQAREVMKPSGDDQRVLVVCGYSFGDSHINMEVDRALRESRGSLTVAIFTDAVALTGVVQRWAEDPEIREQVLVYSKRGFVHGDTLTGSDTDLDWWKFEVLAELLGGAV